MSCDPYWNETVVLLNLNGTDGSTTAFADQTGLNTWTFYGNAHLEDTQKKFGTTSLQLDGTGDYISTTDSARSDFGTGDFTIEAFIRIGGVSGVSDSGSGAKHMAIVGTNPGTTGWVFYVTGDSSNSNLGLGLETKLSGVNSNVSVLQTLTLNTWYHVAVCRASGEVRIFVDGVRIKTATLTADVSGGTTGMQVGTTGLTGYLRYFNGYIDGIRVTKGLCRYNADFTNPATEFEACLLLEEAATDSYYLLEAVAPKSYIGLSVSESADGTDSVVGIAAAIWKDALVAAGAMASTSNTTKTFLDSAAIQDVIQQAIEQLVTDTADGAGTFSLGAASALIEIANAATIHVPSFNVVMSVAELIAAIDVLNGADGYDLTESGDAADTYAARVESVYAMLEAALATETDTVLVYVMQAVTDTAAGATAIDSEGSLVNVLLEEVLLATIYLNIGGELFTGWVLNTDTLAPSEYQFADRQFNSACKHGDKYLMASEDGIYEFTEDVGVESVMTYIKTGKSDFGSDLKKRVVNSYIVYSATGNMVLKVTTSEYGQLQTRNYRMVPPSNSETTDVRRFDIGRGVKSRYWQFELVGDGVDCDIDEIGMLPVVLSRRI